MRNLRSKAITYVYDFGDDWRHKIELEKIIDDYQFGYPTILEGEGACPPEDVGGIPGYEEFLRVWNDPKHLSMKKCANGEKASIIGNLTLLLEITCLRLA